MADSRAAFYHFKRRKFMESMTEVSNIEYAKRIGITFLLSFALFTVTSVIIGEERKARWFKKRTKSLLFFNRRSMVGEFINYGRPCTKEGVLVFIFLMGSIFSFGYWYIF